MAKRSCPFAEYPRERKLFITSKVMDRELTNNMQSVYERTQKMLFDGALKNHDKNRNFIELFPEILEHAQREQGTDDHPRPQILRGQCQLDLTGRLIPYDKANWGKIYKEI